MASCCCCTALSCGRTRRRAANAQRTRARCGAHSGSAPAAQGYPHGARRRRQHAAAAAARDPRLSQGRGATGRRAVHPTPGRAAAWPRDRPGAGRAAHA
eukprot:scaffold26070_cov55-Phaeocystis_antarctica.AAC.4